MRLPICDGKQDHIDKKAALAMIDACMQAGINYYDTAYIYHEGQSEVFLGEALSRYPRNSYYIADKLKLSSNADYRDQFARQLERLKTAHIDFYLMHGISDTNVGDYLTQDCQAYFTRMKEEGKISYLGFSFHGSPAVLEKVIAYRHWDFAQIQFNYFDWYYGSAKEQYELLCEAKIPIMVMEPIHGGMLARISEDHKKKMNAYHPTWSSASWALRFVREKKGIAVILSGMSTLEQVEDNVQTFLDEETLTDQDHALLHQLTQNLVNEVGVLCTGCRYCVSHCPSALDIPGLLRLYNEYQASGKWRLGRLKGAEASMQPSRCVGCHLCTKQCPQQIQVSDYMRKMAEDLKSL